MSPDLTTYCKHCGLPIYHGPMPDWPQSLPTWRHTATGLLTCDLIILAEPAD